MSKAIAFSLVLGLLLFSGCVVEQFMAPGAIAVWQQKDDGDWEVRYSLWNDNTKAWYTPAGPTTALIASIQGDDHDPYIDSDGKETAISVWSHEEESSADIYYSVWHANAWSKPMPVATLSGYDSDPAVAMDQEGNAVSAWVHKSSDGTTMLYYSTYDGSSWSSPAPVSREHTKVSLPELSYSPTSGIYFLLWTESTDAGTRALSSGYQSGTWAPPVEIPGQKNNAVFDTKVPTDQRTGLGTANKKREAIAVWPTTNGELYSSTWTPSGWSTAVLYATDEMPDAEYEYGGVPYSVFIKGRDLHWSRDLYSTGGVTPVPGTGEDYRPALTFIGDRVTGLTVFWTKKALPSEVYFARWDGAAWEPVRPIDVASVPGEDRNPDVSPLMKEVQEWDFYFDWCGDGKIQWPNIWGQFEQCEVGVPCPNPNDFCNAQCLCIPNYPNNTWCGDGVVQRPNSAGVMEECEAGVPCANPNDICNANTCKCTPVQTPPPEEPPEDGYPPGTPPEDGEEEEPEEEPTQGVCGNGLIEGGEQCDIGGGLINGVRQGAAKDTCPLSYSCRSDCTCQLGIVTPRCGDGYISGPEQGANEECDLGGRQGSPTLPDTCPPPTHCSYICRCEEEEVDDGMHYECVEGGCMLMEGEGQNECLHDYNCMHYECQDEECVEVFTPGENECLTSETCKYTHTECDDGECVEVYGEGEDECQSDGDCEEAWHTECIEGECVQVEGEGSWECQSDYDCEPDQYCGDGIIQENRGEECESDNDCDGGVCEGCFCYYPPELDCQYICGQTPGAEIWGHGISQPACYAIGEEYEAEDCTVLCVSVKHYSESNYAGSDSCCCGVVQWFPCSADCTVCDDSVCDENAPSWYKLS